MGSFFHLSSCNFSCFFKFTFCNETFELSRPNDICSLTDHDWTESGIVINKWFDTRYHMEMMVFTLSWLKLLHRIRKGLNMFRSRTATSTNDVKPAFFSKSR